MDERIQIRYPFSEWRIATREEALELVEAFYITDKTEDIINKDMLRNITVEELLNDSEC